MCGWFERQRCKKEFRFYVKCFSGRINELQQENAALKLKRASNLESAESALDKAQRLLDRVETLDAENTRLRRALDLLGVPAQATKDPDKAPPLRITVEIARKAMEIANG